MLGVEGRLGADDRSERIRPHELEVGAGRLRVVSMGFLVDDEETALMWRGLMLNRAVQHFLEDVDWGDLDYLLIDMPPGTGDVQMGLAKLLPRAEMIVVTTPSLSAQKVAIRVVDMGRKNYLRVAGVIENMSELRRRHRSRAPPVRHRRRRRARRRGRASRCSGRSRSSPPWPRAATRVAPSPRRGTGGRGVPSTSPGRSIDEIVPPADLAGCSARLLDAVDAALAAATN